MPYIILGSSLRVVVDNEILPKSIFTVTPGIYLTVFLVTFSAFVISRYFKNPSKVMFYFGLLFSAIFIFPLIGLFKNLNGALMVLSSFSLVSLVYLVIERKLKLKFLSGFFSELCMISHFWDASATFVAVDFFNAWEQHPMTRYFTGIFGTTASFYFLKLIVISLALYVLDSEVKDESLNSWLKIVIIILGLATGTRDFLLLLTAL